MLARILPKLRDQYSLKTALDLGCGVGHYSALLSEFGFEVLGADGREENVLEARGRYPHLNFQVADAQDRALSNLGQFDFVFCFGLLYHLENPFETIRSISKMTRKIAAIEGIVYPSPEPAMVLLDENTGDDQGLNYVAYYPSETCLVKMLCKSGLTECYLPAEFPDHTEYHPGKNGFRRRSVFFASSSRIENSVLQVWGAPPAQFNHWTMVPLYPIPTMLSRIYGVFDRAVYSKIRPRQRN